MNQKELEAFAREAAKGIKTEKDLNSFSQMLTKITVEAALNAELEEHLGYEKHQSSLGGNSRNGFSSKQIKTEEGQFAIDVPRDRNGDFEPLLVKKHQTRFTSMDDKILSLYAKGMTTREIVATFKEMYDADISATLISRVTDAVIEQVVEWQSRPLDAVYPIVYLDCIVVKIRQDKQVINKAIYLALGVNMEGHKELLGMWLSENEGAKFWLNVLTELQNRGVKDILIACVDGLKGFPDAINTAFPKAQIQLCIVHMVRNSVRYVPWKDYKAVTADLKKVYQSVTEDEALLALDAFSEHWDEKYPQISRSWRAHWQNLNTLFLYPQDIRKAIYTTNAIESLNSVIRKALKKRKLFPTDDSAKKVVYLAIQDASKKWTMPIRNWKSALNRFMIQFEDRLQDYI
ncbi:IS256 family transposase [Methylophaga nitratireducenticrescens]|jgi:transposase-like protein|uniref:IS256 family transposase n=1 Tax=Methylophaga nitratireducenticrescens TaxID=754476 RepID=UPI000CDBBDF5|nr:IS256 family transposase [Methylophaga nitratireducenticrescens]AUZ83790.1 IS256 family transposase [Methylophaga nitratireducenticrescens]AUZ83805.1 IS256 family transposase [Methylophaga nitratireducenticrescens]AUZ84001.1 IS256 family transposase [Methylophaga nitratireducenticrescens]AUZ84699.1 IS256 family transposase [Methylophaga nitratireducenticrescens]AUZ84942.1 IS256 family transposase [Methylophaga nitratireducenticrescens]